LKPSLLANKVIAIVLGMVLFGPVATPFAFAPLSTTDINIDEVSSQFEIIEIKNGNLDPGPSLSDVAKEFSNDVQMILQSATECDCESLEIKPKGVLVPTPARSVNVITVDIIQSWLGTVTCVKEEGTGCSVPIKAEIVSKDFRGNVVKSVVNNQFTGWLDDPSIAETITIKQVNVPNPSPPPPTIMVDAESLVFQKKSSKLFQLTAECKGDCDGKPDKNKFSTNYKILLDVDTTKKDANGNLITNPHPIGGSLTLRLFNENADCNTDANVTVLVEFVTTSAGQIDSVLANVVPP